MTPDYLITNTPGDDTTGAITIDQLENLDKEEWTSIEINTPMSNETIEHLINRFLRDEV